MQDQIKPEAHHQKSLSCPIHLVPITCPLPIAFAVLHLTGLYLVFPKGGPVPLEGGPFVLGWQRKFLLGWGRGCLLKASASKLIEIQR